MPDEGALPAPGHHRHRDAAAAGLRARSDGDGADRPDLLGEAGHRRDAAQPGRGRHAASARSPTATGTRAAAATPTAARSSSTCEDNGADKTLACTDKFGRPVDRRQRRRCRCDVPAPVKAAATVARSIGERLERSDAASLVRVRLGRCRPGNRTACGLLRRADRTSAARGPRARQRPSKR